MKKFLLLLTAAAAGVLIWRRVEAEREGRDLWHEVTDPLPTQSRS